MGSIDESGLFRLNIVANERIAQTNYMYRQQTQDNTISTTDKAGAFNEIDKQGNNIEHLTVNHSGQIDPKTGIWHYFKDMTTGVHNNPAEGLFGFFKRFVMKHPVMNQNSTRTEQYIAEMETRYNRGCNIAAQVFLTFLVAMAHVIPPGGNALVLYVVYFFCFL